MPRSQPLIRRPWIERLWLGDLPWYQNALWGAMAPASLAYQVVARARNTLWRLAKRQPPLRAISIGNLTVGGNGKTPFALFVASRLRAHGLSVGIVSRGFGGRLSQRARASIVSDGREIRLTPEQAGDEPVMIAKSFAGPVAIARRRIDGVRLLDEIARCDVVILDDAFQHLRLARDADLVLVSHERGLGNGWLLPAGPMREPLDSVVRADAVVMVSSHPLPGPGALTARQMAALSRVPVLRATLRPRALVRSENERWIEMPLGLAGRRAVAVSGLANPGSFYAMLRELDADLVAVLEYPDHHRYTAADWQAIVNASHGAEAVITTEKDLVKLERFPFPRGSLYALRLEIVMSEADAAQLDRLAMGAARPCAAAEA